MEISIKNPELKFQFSFPFPMNIEGTQISFSVADFATSCNLPTIRIFKLSVDSHKAFKLNLVMSSNLARNCFCVDY
jgi:hypothetical protein